MAKTEDQKRDAYYLKKYGVGLDWYNARLVEQDHKCGICRRPQSAFKFRLAVDHDHGWRKVKIESGKNLSASENDHGWWKVKIESGKNLSASENDHGWFARAFYLGAFIRTEAMKKAEAMRKMKARLKFKSCRGLLCPFCNRGLRFYADDPARLAGAAEYLKRHQNS